jgi:N-acetylmuramoyl-L-alanine amidase
MIVVIQPGDCISSLAAEYGLPWKVIWEHPNNAQLKALRKTPNVLAVGDQVFVPQVEPPKEDRETRRRHNFVLKDTPARLRMVFSVEGEPRAGEQCTVEVDGVVTKTTLDGEGLLDAYINPKAKSATIWLENRPKPLQVQLGALEPKDTLKGVQQRLSNLGFPVGEPDGKFGPKTHGALLRFQKQQGLEPLGQADAATIARLDAVHEAEAKLFKSSKGASKTGAAKSSQTVTVVRGAHGVFPAYLPGETQLFCGDGYEDRPEGERLDLLQAEYQAQDNDAPYGRRQVKDSDAKHLHNDPLWLPYLLMGNVHFIAPEQFCVEAPAIRARLLREGELLISQMESDLDLFEDTCTGFWMSLGEVVGQAAEIPADIVALARRTQAEVKPRADTIVRDYCALHARLLKVYGSLSGDISYRTLYNVGCGYQQIRTEVVALNKRIRGVQKQIEAGWDINVGVAKWVDATAWGALDIITDGISMFNPAYGLGYKVGILFIKHTARTGGNYSAKDFAKDKKTWDRIKASFDKGEFKNDVKALISAAARNLFKRGKVPKIGKFGGKAFGGQSDYAEAAIEFAVGILVDVFWFYAWEKDDLVEEMKENLKRTPEAWEIKEMEGLYWDKWITDQAWAAMGKVIEAAWGNDAKFGAESHIKNMARGICAKIMSTFVGHYQKQFEKIYTKTDMPPSSWDVAKCALYPALQDTVVQLPAIFATALANKYISGRVEAATQGVDSQSTWTGASALRDRWLDKATRPDGERRSDLENREDGVWKDKPDVTRRWDEHEARLEGRPIKREDRQNPTIAPAPAPVRPPNEEIMNPGPKLNVVEPGDVPVTPPAPKQLAAGEQQPEPKLLTAGEQKPEPKLLTAGEQKPEPKQLTAGEQKPEPKLLTAGEPQPERKMLTAGEQKPEPKLLTAGEQKPEPKLLGSGKDRAIIYLPVTQEPKLLLAKNPTEKKTAPKRNPRAPNQDQIRAANQEALKRKQTSIRATARNRP